jgi:hypothetical protein
MIQVIAIPRLEHYQRIADITGYNQRDSAGNDYDDGNGKKHTA